MKPIFALLSILLVPLANAQSVSAATTTPGLYYAPSQMPPMLVPQFLALGSRLQQPGNERIHLTGMMTTADGASLVQIVIELGGKLKVTWTNEAIVFDGTTVSVSGSVSESGDVLKAFVDDLAETLMLTAGKGTLPRLLGRQFTNPAGGLCDYYDVPTLGQAVKQSKPQIKRYCFDSTTSLLNNVRYKNSSYQDEITQYGAWEQVNRQAVPGIITRIVGGNQVFQFHAQSVAVSASVADSTFSLQ